MPEYSREELQTALEDMTARASLLQAKVEALEHELVRSREWRRSTLLAVVAVALLAILMLGIVAFNAVDGALDEATWARAVAVAAS